MQVSRLVGEHLGTFPIPYAPGTSESIHIEDLLRDYKIHVLDEKGYSHRQLKIDKTVMILFQSNDTVNMLEKYADNEENPKDLRACTHLDLGNFFRKVKRFTIMESHYNFAKAK